MSCGKRTKVARCIWRDLCGYQIIVQRGGHIERRRFPLATPLHELADTRDTLIDELETGRCTTAARGTLAADVARALDTLPAGSHNRRDVRTLLDHWLAAPLDLEGEATTFGATARSLVTPLHVRTALAVFRAARRADGRPHFSPKTIKELRRVLAWVYTTLDGPEGRNPVRGVKVTRVKYDDPRGIDYAIIERILAQCTDRGRPQDGPLGGRRGKTARPTQSLTKIRLRVMAYTGMHQSEIGKLQPRDVDLKRGRVWIGPREKGAGAPGAWHQLLTPGVAALLAFVQVKAFGPFSTRSMSKSWNLALAKAKAAWEAEPGQAEPWPVHADARPYDLRHSMGTAIYLASGDIRAAQEILRHRQGTTTDRYTKAGVTPRAALALAAMDKLLVGASGGSKLGGRNVTKRPPMSTRQRTPKARRGHE